MLRRHEIGRPDEDHTAPNQQWQPVFEETFHPEVRRLKSENSTETPNIEHPILNVQYYTSNVLYHEL